MKQFVEKAKLTIKRIPILGKIVSMFYMKIMALKFRSSKGYWIKRYAMGGNSGSGSYSRQALFKAEILNSFVGEHNIETVLEYGCGDGNQLKLVQYRNYLGFDVSPDAINRCKKIFHNDKTKEFKLMKEYSNERADLTLSLDVIFHLVEEDVFSSYMKRLFSSADQFVIIYSSDKEQQEQIQAPHVRHRKFTRWIEVNVHGWKPLQHIPNRYPYKGSYQTESFADFYIYEKSDTKE